MNPSASALRRVTECPASMVLPQAGQTTAAAKKGTENHKAIEEAIDSKDYQNLSPKLATFLSRCTDCEVEVAYALNVKTGAVRYIGSKLGRNYGALERFEIPGTIDLVCRVDGVLYAVDWKSRTRVEDAATNPQIGFGAACAMLHHGDDECMGGLWYLNDDWFDVAMFTRIDLSTFLRERVAMFDRLYALADEYTNGSPVSVSAGPWCQYCAAMPHCPAKTRLALAMIDQLQTIRGAVATMTDEQAGVAWEKSQEISTILESVQHALKERIAESGGLPVEGGAKLVVLREEKMSGYDFDAIKASFAEAGQDVPRKVGIKMVTRKIKAA